MQQTLIIVAAVVGSAVLVMWHQRRIEKRTMGKLDDIIDGFNTATNAVAARIDALQLKVGEAVTADQFAKLAALQAHLQSLGADPANPLPAPPPDPAPVAPPATSP